MAGTGNGPEVLNRSPGPVTRLQLDRKIKCDVCEALIVPTSTNVTKRQSTTTIHWENSGNATSAKRIFKVSQGWHNTKSLIEVQSWTKEEIFHATSANL